MEEDVNISFYKSWRIGGAAGFSSRLSSSDVPFLIDDNYYTKK